ncbi:hypothetical protein [Actinoallomurus sp. NPDC050550]|uniref:hypothetical protein n=1 Tax=Actinoallomurus sp. NPDC050550 TaxID=3154937 RepID=UPI0033E1840D
MVLREVLGLLRLAAGRVSRPRRLETVAMTRAESRELAEVMRALPDRYADRLPERTLRHVTDDAAAGKWEHAVEQTIGVLASRAVPVSAAERDQLAGLADALGLPVSRIADLHTDADAGQDAGEVAGLWAT